MTCAILTPDRIDDLLRGTVAAAERPLLLAHLSAPCEACLDVLSGPAGEEMLARLGGEGLTAAESERLLRLAAPVRRRPRWDLRASLALAAAAVAAVLLVVRPLPESRLKGASAAPAATLIALAARPGEPGSIHLLPAGAAKVDRGEVLLLRIRLSASAFVYLVGMPDAGPAQVLWQEEKARPAGEFELGRDGQALSIDPRALGRDPLIALVASPAPIEPFRLRQLPRDARQMAAALPGCGVDLLRPELEP